MILIKRPMLASKITMMGVLKYPVLGSPKFDGIRALTRPNDLVSRKLKSIPNDYVRSLATGLPENMDGELMIPAGQFNQSSSAIMRKDGCPLVKYHVFDYVKTRLDVPARQRALDLEQLVASLPVRYKDFVVLVKQIEIADEDELLDYEELCLEQGYEGVMVRDPNGPYKEGRSSEPEGYLLKLKRMEDSEAVIVGFEEKMHNENPLETDALGYAKRSQAQAGWFLLGRWVSSMCMMSTPRLSLRLEQERD